MSNILLHIGYPKAGSTFLQKWFSGHPQLAFTYRTLCGFHSTFDVCDFAYKYPNKKISYFVTSEEAFSVWFKTCGVGINVVHLDVKQHQKKVCEILRQMFPNARLLIVTRGYEQTMRSFYSEYVKYGGHYHFEKYLRVFTPLFKEYLDHNFLIKLYEDTFCRENVLALPFELLQENPSKFIQHIEIFLGLEHFNSGYPRVNPSLGDGMLSSYRMLSGALLKALKVLPEDIARPLFDCYRSCLLHKWLDFITFGMSKIFPHRKMQRIIPQNVLHEFTGNGNILKNYDAFQPYLHHYLIF